MIPALASQVGSFCAAHLTAEQKISIPQVAIVVVVVVVVTVVWSFHPVVVYRLETIPNENLTYESLTTFVSLLRHKFTLTL